VQSSGADDPDCENDLVRYTFMCIHISGCHCAGILVALTIQKCGIVFRLILGTLSICLCILIEAVCFNEPVMARELLAITMASLLNRYLLFHCPLVTNALVRHAKTVHPHRSRLLQRARHGARASGHHHGKSIDRPGAAYKASP
jgi:hypothetical protein